MITNMGHFSVCSENILQYDKKNDPNVIFPISIPSKTHTPEVNIGDKKLTNAISYMIMPIVRTKEI